MFKPGGVVAGDPDPPLLDVASGLGEFEGLGEVFVGLGELVGIGEAVLGED